MHTELTIQNEDIFLSQSSQQLDPSHPIPRSDYFTESMEQDIGKSQGEMEVGVGEVHNWGAV